MSTFTSLHYHIVFSTKERRPQIADDWRGRLHEYIGGTVNGLAGQSEQVGGVADHVHLLFGLKTTHCIADVMRELKRQTSIWVHQEIGLKSFAWQEGYAAFTVSADNRAGVVRYITNQEKHHLQRSFHTELKAMLDRAGIVYRRQIPQLNARIPPGCPFLGIPVTGGSAARPPATSSPSLRDEELHSYAEGITACSRRSSEAKTTGHEHDHALASRRDASNYTLLSLRDRLAFRVIHTPVVALRDHRLPAYHRFAMKSCIHMPKA